MENQDFHLTLAVSSEQLETITHLFSHYHWNYEEINRTRRPAAGQIDSNFSDVSTQTEATDNSDENDEVVPQFIIPHNLEETECRYCLCKPCITNEQNRQLWWETKSQPPHQRNTGLRKDKYKRFWTMMFHREA